MKTALITGSTSGIGYETAKLFSNAGFRVIIHGRNSTRGKEIAHELHGEFLKADITNPQEVAEMFSKIKRLDVLINNAGGVIGSDTFKTASELDLITSFKTNFFGAFYCCQEAAKIMSKGVIINVGSVCGLGSSPVGESQAIPVYSAAKSALHNFSQNLAKTLAPKIRVNLLIPGYTKSRAWSTKMSLIIAVKGLAKQTKINRFNTAEEVANAIFFLATNEAMTGSQLVVDGGLQLK